MATQLNIEETHKGESLIICLEAKNPDGTTISFPEEQEVILTIAKTATGEPFLQFDEEPRIALTDAADGKWLIEIEAAALEGLQENRVYHYNIWTRRNGRDWLQGYGRLKRLESIAPTIA